MNSNQNPNSNKPERRKNHTPGRIANRICLCSVAVLFFAIAALNLFQFDRPTVSQAEKRELARFPDFSFSALADGSYFSGISDWVSDTFWQRETMVKLSSKFQALHGFEYKMDGQSYVVIDNPSAETGEETTVDRSVYADITIPLITTEASPETSAVTEEITSGTAESHAYPDDTQSPETSAVDTQSEQTTAPEVTTEEPFRYISLKLSQNSAELEADSMLMLTAALVTSGNGTEEAVRWTVSDSSLLTLSGNGKTATLLALKEGNVTVKAEVGGLSDSCTIKITKKTVKQDIVQELTGSIFIYGDAIYQRINYSGTSLNEVSADYSTLCRYYAAVFPGATVSFLPTPHAVLMLDTAKVPKAGRDQTLIFADMAKNFDPSVNFVDVSGTMKQHRSEYLYFRTDHHWTPLGAYYAYTKFAETRGFTPTALSQFSSKTIRTDYSGSYASYLKDYSVTMDTLTFYYPTKDHKMTITYTPTDAKSVGSTTATYSTCIISGIFKSYNALLSGDRPMVTINVPANSKANGGSGKSILVLKDSYGSALVPYLCEHYENIVAVDPRYYSYSFSQTIQNQLSSYKFDDVLITVNVMMANSYTWLNMFYSIAGVKIQ